MEIYYFLENKFTNFFDQYKKINTFRLWMAARESFVDAEGQTNKPFQFFDLSKH